MKKILVGPVFVLLALSVILLTGRGEALSPADVQVNGSFSANSFLGDGSALTNISASSLTGVLPIVNGGTGSSTQNFVDLTTTQVIGGTKTFSNTINGSISGNAATATTAQGVNAGVIVTGSLADRAVTSSKISFYENVAIVAISGGDYSDPATAMSNYSVWCGTPSSTNPCLLKIMPGVYNVGSSPVVMQPYIDIEGSGENTTTITGAISSSSYSPTDGTVTGASNAEIRFLTVANTGTGNYTAAILNRGASPSMIHVTATASGATASSYGVLNNSSSSPTMTNVTATASGTGTASSYGVYNDGSSSPIMTTVIATASGGTNNYGVYNKFVSSPTMMNVTVTASGVTKNYGVYNDFSSSPTMTNVTATVSGGTYNYGVYNDNSSLPTMMNVTATASGGIYNDGVYNNASYPTMMNVTATASGGILNHGVENSNSQPIMTNVIATASGGPSNYGVYNDGSRPTMTNVTATASGGTNNYGVYNTGGGGIVKINHSVISGSTNTIFNDTGVTTYVGSTQLAGGAVSNGGTMTCAGMYDENYTFYASTCP